MRKKSIELRMQRTFLKCKSIRLFASGLNSHSIRFVNDIKGYTNKNLSKREMAVDLAKKVVRSQGNPDWSRVECDTISPTVGPNVRMQTSYTRKPRGGPVYPFLSIQMIMFFC